MTSNNRIYVLPNLITTLGLFTGFFSIISSANQSFEIACIAIFCAMIFDAIDGRVARMTNSQSEFGAQYDSLADVVSFGLAPAILVYHYAMVDAGKVGWLAVFIYVAFAAMRLARFNASSASSNLKYFIGLASPAAAGVLVSLVWIFVEFEFNKSVSSVVLIYVTPLLGLLMVSQFRYSAFKNVNLFAAKPFFVLMIATLVLVILVARPAETLFFIFATYAVSGPVIGLIDFKLSKFTHKQDADFKEEKEKEE